LVVAPGDPKALGQSIKRLLDDGSLAGRLGDAGRRVVIERFNIRSNIEPLLRLF
jgi:hypothetical protein